MITHYIYDEHRLYIRDASFPVGITPDNSTTTPPLPAKGGFGQVFSADGWSYVDLSTISLVPLADVQQEASTAVDSHAADTRLRFITDTKMQVDVYNMKAAEAEAYIAAGYPASGSKYPLLAAEASATGQTKRQLADSIVATRSAWMSILGQIEGIRIAAKAGITSAVDANAITGIKQQAFLDLDAL